MILSFLLLLKSLGLVIILFRKISSFNFYLFKEEEEREAQSVWREKAKKELDDWYNHYNEQLDKVKKENRLAQEQFIEETTDTKPGNLWEKTARYCDFNPKYSKNTKDVSRMRGLLLQLKQNPLPAR